MGAGASRTAGIPTAPLLVKRVNEAFGHCLGGLSDVERSDYGRVMGALAPGDRKSLIQPLLDESRVNWGHIALACITRHAKVKRMLTFNFDLILERAASLVGIHLPVYDFGVAPTRDIGGLAAPAIFHLHGQSYGLRLMNSEAETAAHKETLRPLLADSLRNHLTIVIGYSGEADAAFKVMEEEFNSHQNLIWLGYEAEPKPHLSGLLSKDYAFYIGGCDFDRTMIDLAETLGCWPPLVITNPSRHILTELTEVATYPVEPETGLDLLTSTRRRLEEAADQWEISKDGEARAQDALISGVTPDPTEAGGALSENELEARAWSKITEGHERIQETVGGRPKEAVLEACRFAASRYEEAIALKPDIYQAWQAWGAALFIEASRHDDVQERMATRRLAQEKFAKAEQLAPGNPRTLLSWARVLADGVGDMKGNEAQERFTAAKEKFYEVLRLQPDNGIAYDSLGALFLRQSNVLTGGEREKLLAEAAEVLDKAKAFIGKANYNRACVYAMQGDLDNAIAELKACLADGTLPSRKHLNEDTDMDLLRDEPEFLSVLNQAKAD